MRVVDAGVGQNAKLPEISEVLGKLGVGDVLRARVLDSSSSEVVLKLSDGSVIKATSMIPLDIQKGQLVEFLVKNKNENQLFIETIKGSRVDGADSKNLEQLKAQLLSIDIKPDEDSIEVAKALKSNNLSISSENIKTMLDSIKAFNGLTASKAAFLASNGLIPEEKNISSLNALLDNNQKIGKSMEGLKSLILGIEDENASKVIEEKFSKLEKLLKTDSLGSLSDSKNTKMLELATRLINENINKSNDEQSKNLYKSILNNGLDEFVNIADDSLTGNIEKNIPDKLINFINKKLSTENTNNKNISDNTSDINNSNNPNSQNTNNPKLLNSINNSNLSKISSDNIKDLSNLFKNSTNEQIVSDLKNILNEIKQSRNIPNSQINEDNKINTDKSVNRVFDKLFIEIDSLKQKNEIDIKSLYKEINKTLDMIKEAVSQTDIPMKDQIFNKTDNISNNIRFMAELNNHSTYLQIPLKIANQNTNCELYVLKKGTKRKKIDADNVTAYISLDTSNIGKVDSLISIKNKNISINMRLMSEEVRNFVKENHDELYLRLQELNYKLVDLKCRVSEENIDIVNVNEVLKKEIQINSIDIQL